jgi:hypothetical protein
MATHQERCDAYCQAALMGYLANPNCHLGHLVENMGQHTPEHLTELCAVAMETMRIAEINHKTPADGGQ